ncbi:hypothetical protein KI387_012351, partial [Taxus chinensis]
ACEIFILELTLHSWLHTEENNRHTLQRYDIAGAVNRGDILNFLVNIVRRDDIKINDNNNMLIGFVSSLNWKMFVL